MQVHRHGGEHQAGQAAHGEQTHEAEGVEDRRLEGDRTFVKRHRPVQHLDRRGDGDEEAQHREDECGVHRLARDEHVMAPDQKAEDRDGNAREGDEVIAEDGFLGECAD